MANVLATVRTPSRARLGEVRPIDRAALPGKASRHLGRSGTLFLVSTRPHGAVWLIAIVEDARVASGSIFAYGTPNTSPIVAVSDLVEVPDAPRALAPHETARLRERVVAIAHARPNSTPRPPVRSQLALQFAQRKAITATTRFGPIELRQLQAIGRRYFGAGHGTTHIAGPREDGDPMQTRALVHVTRWGIFAGKRRVFDAWFYMGDSGSIFRAGTAREVAEVVQGGLQCTDPNLRAALGPALVAAHLLSKSDASYRQFAALLAAQQRLTPRA